MSLGFDIFRRPGNGSPPWIAQADTLDDAQRRLEAFRTLHPGTYLVRDASTGKPVGEDVDE